MSLRRNEFLRNALTVSPKCLLGHLKSYRQLNQKETTKTKAKQRHEVTPAHINYCEQRDF